MKTRYTSLFVTIFVMIFMYLPIVMLISQSFNESRYGGKWMGFSLKWYEALFRDSAVINATLNTLLVAFVATALSTAIGTCAAWTLNKYRLSKLQSAHYVLIYAPMCVPDILMGISLLLMFVSLKVDLGLTTVILAHTTFCLSFVTFTVLARLARLRLQHNTGCAGFGRRKFQNICKNHTAASRARNRRRSDDGFHSVYGRLRGDILRGRSRKHHFAGESLQHDEARAAGHYKRPECCIHGAYIHSRDCRTALYAQKILNQETKKK